MMTPDEFVETYREFVGDLPDALSDWDATGVEFRDATRSELKNLLLKRAPIVADCRSTVRRLRNSAAMSALQSILSIDELLLSLADVIERATGLDIELFIMPPEVSVSGVAKAAAQAQREQANEIQAA